MRRAPAARMHLAISIEWNGSMQLREIRKEILVILRWNQQGFVL
jgi:hypothetical protein